MGKEKLYTLIKSPIITEQTAQLGEKLKQGNVLDTSMMYYLL